MRLAGHVGRRGGQNPAGGVARDKLWCLVVLLAPRAGVIYTVSIALAQECRSDILAALACTLGICLICWPPCSASRRSCKPEERVAPRPDRAFGRDGAGTNIVLTHVIPQWKE